MNVCWINQPCPQKKADRMQQHGSEVVTKIKGKIGINLNSYKAKQASDLKDYLWVIKLSRYLCHPIFLWIQFIYWMFEVHWWTLRRAKHESNHPTGKQKQRNTCYQKLLLIYRIYKSKHIVR